MCHNKTVFWSEGLELAPPLDPLCLWHYRVSWAQCEQSFLVTPCCCGAGQGKPVVGCSQGRSQGLPPLSSGKGSVALRKPKNLHGAGGHAMCACWILFSPISNPSSTGAVSWIPQWPCSAWKDRTPGNPFLPQTKRSGLALWTAGSLFLPFPLLGQFPTTAFLQHVEGAGWDQTRVCQQWNITRLKTRKWKFKITESLTSSPSAVATSPFSGCSWNWPGQCWAGVNILCPDTGVRPGPLSSSSAPKCSGRVL